jgi:site-specific recombinase XerD
VVYRRGEVYWYRIRLTLAAADGSKQPYDVRQSAHTNRRREAEQLEREHRRALSLGEVHPLDPWPPAVSPQAPTLKGFSERFLKHVRLHAKASTAVFYENCLKRTLPFHPLSEIPMDKVTGELISKYIRFRQSLPAGNSVAALNGEIRTLRHCFNLAEEWALIPKAPVIHELPGKVNRERVVTFEEERKYLGAASANLRDIAILAADTGLRPNSELFTLEWANVHTNASAEGPHGHIHIPGGKTGAARRNIPLTPRGKAILEARRTRKVLRFYVFPGRGKSGHLVTIQHSHERAVKKSGVDAFEFYCWRHTCGTRWAESGMDKYTVARLMGHSSPRVAERYYIHVTEPHVTSGFERFVSYLERRLTPSVDPHENEVKKSVRGKKGAQ